MIHQPDVVAAEDQGGGQIIMVVIKKLLCGQSQGVVEKDWLPEFSPIVYSEQLHIVAVLGEDLEALEFGDARWKNILEGRVVEVPSMVLVQTYQIPKKRLDHNRQYKIIQENYYGRRVFRAR